jgi:hypothetical protein
MAQQEDSCVNFKRKGDREWRDGESYIIIEEHELG